jgi:hypothetical protein
LKKSSKKLLLFVPVPLKPAPRHCEARSGAAIQQRAVEAPNEPPRKSLSESLIATIS